MGKGLLTEVEMAQRQLHHTVQPADSSTGYPVSFPSALVGLNPFQAASLVSELS